MRTIEEWTEAIAHAESVEEAGRLYVEGLKGQSYGRIIMLAKALDDRMKDPELPPFAEIDPQHFTDARRVQLLRDGNVTANNTSVFVRHGPAIGDYHQFIGSNVIEACDNAIRALDALSKADASLDPQHFGGVLPSGDS